jgi:hypothetical protein
VKLSLLKVLQTLFLACFVSILVLWIASYYGDRREVRWRDSNGDSHWIASSHGELQYGLTGEWKNGAGPSWYPASELTPALLAAPPPTLLNKLGFGLTYTANLRLPPGWRPGQAESYALFRTIWIPYWFISFPFLIMGVSIIARRLKRRLRSGRSGGCPQCGYDLRATPDRCPECGAVPAASRGEDSLSKSLRA